MKYKTFRGLLIGGGALVLTGGIIASCIACSGDSKPNASSASAKAESKPTATSPATTTTTTAAPPSSATSPAASDPGALRPMDQKILDKVHAGLESDKVKDAFKSEAYKVNLYKEAGKVRAKVDLDRDEKADEKWDFETEGGQEVVKRRVATKDDEKYDLEYRLEGGKWVEKK